jgi:hypothetical protein
MSAKTNTWRNRETLKPEKVIQPKMFPMKMTDKVNTGKTKRDSKYHLTLPRNKGLIPVSYQPSPAKALRHNVAISGAISHKSIPRPSSGDVSIRTFNA